MIYRVSRYTEMDGHDGYEYFRTKAGAEHAAQTSKFMGWDVKVEEFETPKSKGEMIALLNAVAGHADNG